MKKPLQTDWGLEGSMATDSAMCGCPWVSKIAKVLSDLRKR